jgi:O-antigen ligase
MTLSLTRPVVTPPLPADFRAAAPAAAPAAPKCMLGFCLFIALNATLLVRPEEIIPALLGLHLYQILIIATVIASLPALAETLRPAALKQRPISLLALGMLPAVLLSLLTHFRIGDAIDAGSEFGKVMVYYALFISLITSLGRLRWFLVWLALFIVVLAVVALLQYHDVVNIASLEVLEQAEPDDEGEIHVIRRLVSTGIYNDPNDLCLVLVFGMAICLYWMSENRMGQVRFLWLAPLITFGYALTLTNSRGGFMGMLGGMVVLFQARFGWKKAVPLIAVALTLMLMLFAGGRQTDVNLSDTEDSAQARIQLWREGLELFKTAPVFGIGKGEYEEEVVQVAHNSFVHCFTELGMFGGTLFTGAFFLAGWSLHKAGVHGKGVLAPDLLRLRPYLLAAVLAYVVGMFSLSRAYIVPTYLMLGLADAYLALPGVAGRMRAPKMSLKLVGVLVLVSLCTLVALHVFVKIYAQ